MVYFVLVKILRGLTSFIKSIGYLLVIRIGIDCKSTQEITATAALVVDPCVALIIGSKYSSGLAAGSIPDSSSIYCK